MNKLLLETTSMLNGVSAVAIVIIAAFIGRGYVGMALGAPAIGIVVGVVVGVIFAALVNGVIATLIEIYRELVKIRNK